MHQARWLTRAGRLSAGLTLCVVAAVATPADAQPWVRRELATPQFGAVYNAAGPVGFPTTQVFFEADQVPRVGFLNNAAQGFNLAEPFLAEVDGYAQQIDALVPLGTASRASFEIDAGGQLVYGLDQDALWLGTRDGAGGYAASTAPGTLGFAGTFLRLDSQGKGYAVGRKPGTGEWAVLEQQNGGAWANEVLDFLGDTPVISSVALAIDASDRPVLAFNDQTSGFTIRRRDAPGNWAVLFSAGGSVNPVSVSLTAGPNGGEVAAAYRDAGQVSVVLIDPGGAVSHEVVQSGGFAPESYVQQGSLAFDVHGDLALALTSDLGFTTGIPGAFETANDVLLATRNAPGLWSFADTGVDDAFQAALGFDDFNSPYLAVVEYRAISLVSPAILPPLPADANLDGVVDLLDFEAMAVFFGQGVTGGAAEGDFNGDGVVDLLDFDLLAQSFGQGASPATVSQPVTGPVPEPAALVIFALAGPLTWRRRR